MSLPRTTSATEEDPSSATNDDSESLQETFLRARLLIESSTSLEQAVAQLETVQRDVHALGMFSPNEGLEDISTKSLPFLTVEHYLALALVGLPIRPGHMAQRKKLILRSLDLWSTFLGTLERLELLSNEEVKEYHRLMEDDVGDDVDFTSRSLPPPNREAKIARFKAKQQTKKEIERLKALRERRQRYGIAATEEMDGYDDESLSRTVALSDLSIQKLEALEQWAQSKDELPMIEMMVKKDEENQHMQRHGGKHASSDERRPQLSSKPLQVTRITKDAAGQIQVKREEIRSKVFRPGWNQPTMTLEELGEREYHAAIEREERQKEAEANKLDEPRRYEDLVRDGMEDNTDLVDASAKLDREWDDFKEANPRGSGNKMGNRGDKNF